MHPINKFLSYFGVQLYKSKRQAGFPKGFRKFYNTELKKLQRNPPAPFKKVFSDMIYEMGEHPASYVDYECAFAANALAQTKPSNILDVGSYRHFILGLLGSYKVTTLDVRPRNPISKNETIVTGDAKKINLPDNSFDAVVSLCTLEHFGLGRYGDEIDLQADKQTLKEMVRVLISGGKLIFTTEFTTGEPSLLFNACKIYSYDMIRQMCENLGLKCEEEKFFSRTKGDWCGFEEITKEEKKHDVYAGCWTK